MKYTFIIALTEYGREYAYSRIKAYTVCQSKADYICSLLNNSSWNIDNPRQYWKVYYVDNYELKQSNAYLEKLVLRKNRLFIRQNILS